MVNLINLGKSATLKVAAFTDYNIQLPSHKILKF